MLENKLSDLQEKQRMLALNGKAAKVEMAQAKQQELKLEKNIRDVREEFKSKVDMEDNNKD